MSSLGREVRLISNLGGMTKDNSQPLEAGKKAYKLTPNLMMQGKIEHWASFV